MVVLILLLVGSSWYFARVTKELDAPGTPVLETNAVKIQTMQEVVDRVEGAIEKRTKMY
jgi:hypothetical protein